jgi:hypothetical protein
VGAFYEDFEQVNDEEVKYYLENYGNGKSRLINPQTGNRFLSFKWNLYEKINLLL